MKLKLSNVLYRILAIVTGIVMMFVLANVISGAKPFAVVTESMRPTYRRGDVVFVRPVAFEPLKENDVVTVILPIGSSP